MAGPWELSVGGQPGGSFQDPSPAGPALWALSSCDCGRWARVN